MKITFVKHEIEVLKAFSSQGCFGEIDFDFWINKLVILDRKITDTGLYLNFMKLDCHDEFDESDLIPQEGEVSIESPCLKDGAGFMLFKSASSECIFSLEGYTYGDSWLSPDCNFKIIL